MPLGWKKESCEMPFFNANFLIEFLKLLTLLNKVCQSCIPKKINVFFNKNVKIIVASNFTYCEAINKLLEIARLMERSHPLWSLIVILSFNFKEASDKLMRQ